MEKEKLNQLLMLVFNYGKNFERTQDFKYSLENALKDFGELETRTKEDINPTTLKYFNILQKYWNQTQGDRILTIIDKKGNFASNKKSLIKIFSELEEIDGVVSALLFDKKIFIARPAHGYWGITCVIEPTIEMANELRKEANKIKYESKENVDKKNTIAKQSNLFI